MHRSGERALTCRSIFGAHVLAFAIIMWITPKRIGEFFNDLGVRLRDMGWKGMLILSAAVSEYLSSAGGAPCLLLSLPLAACL